MIPWLFFSSSNSSNSSSFLLAVLTVLTISCWCSYFNSSQAVTSGLLTNLRRRHFSCSSDVFSSFLIFSPFRIADSLALWVMAALVVTLVMLCFGLAKSCWGVSLEAVKKKMSSKSSRQQVISLFVLYCRNILSWYPEVKQWGRPELRCHLYCIIFRLIQFCLPNHVRIFFTAVTLWSLQSRDLIGSDSWALERGNVTQMMTVRKSKNNTHVALCDKKGEASCVAASWMWFESHWDVSCEIQFIHLCPYIFRPASVTWFDLLIKITSCISSALHR